MHLRRASVWLGLLVLMALKVSAAAAAEPQVDHRQRATAAFALGHYAEAALSFEKAFELAPEPALLYNAAQAYRLAGNKERALTLYENYLRVYGSQDKRVELESRIEELKKAIEHDSAVATKPPNETEPVLASPPVTAPHALTAPPPAADSTAPVLVSQSPPASSDSRRLTSKPWFWGIVGGAVVAAIVVGVVVASGPKDPSPSLGRTDGN